MSNTSDKPRVVDWSDKDTLSCIGDLYLQMCQWRHAAQVLSVEKKEDEHGSDDTKKPD